MVGRAEGQVCEGNHWPTRHNHILYLKKPHPLNSQDDYCKCAYEAS